MNGLARIFRIGQIWCETQLVTIRAVSHHFVDTWFIFHFSCRMMWLLPTLPERVFPDFREVLGMNEPWYEEQMVNFRHRFQMTIWIQIFLLLAILVRLFNVLRTRHGIGFRCRCASCSNWYVLRSHATWIWCVVAWYQIWWICIPHVVGYIAEKSFTCITQPWIRWMHFICNAMAGSMLWL